MKKINIFVNQINKNISNNQNVSFDRLANKDESIIDKINNIFKDENKIYRINCEITFKNGKQNYIIIGRTPNNLITIDKNLIKISDILDIKKV